MHDVIQTLVRYSCTLANAHRSQTSLTVSASSLTACRRHSAVHKSVSRMRELSVRCLTALTQSTGGSRGTACRWIRGQVWSNHYQYYTVRVFDGDLKVLSTWLISATCKFNRRKVFAVLVSWLITRCHSMHMLTLSVKQPIITPRLYVISIKEFPLMLPYS